MEIEDRMSQVIYIEPDEEIISVIGKLRKVSDRDIFFAIPKRAVFLQSLVNLKLLGQEAKKLKKGITLVTSDPMARALAEKAGIPFRESLESRMGRDISDPGSRLPARLPQAELAAQKLPSRHSSDASMGGKVSLRMESVGSSSFFGSRESREESDRLAPPSPIGQSRISDIPVSRPTSSTSSKADPALRTLPVRDRTPKRLTLLNSSRESIGSSSVPSQSRHAEQAEMPHSQDRSFLSSPSSQTASPLERSRAEISASNSFEFPVPSPATPPDAQPVAPVKQGMDTPLSRFYQSESGDVGPKSAPAASSLSRHSSPFDLRARSIFSKIFFVFIATSALVAISVGIFVFLPKATVTILVSAESDFSEADVTADLAQQVASPEGKRIPLRLIQTEKELTLSFPSTGKTFSADKRARGTVTLSNAFSSSPQSLVATTRLETSDGKIFRLAKGVVIPGETQSNGKVVPGTVTVEVIADEAGDSYNIQPTTFSVPGFKGSPKYEKITARSERSFLGGGGDGSSLSSVSVDDVVKAKESSEKGLADALRSEIRKDLRSGEKLFDDAIQWEVLSMGAFPGTGAVTPSFDYRIKVSARALVVSEDDIRMVASGLFDGNNSDSLRIDYGIPRPDFAAKTMTVKMKASLEKEATLDTEALKEKILGKNLSEVQGIFSEYPRIQKIEVVFWPEFMTSRIPGRSSRVEMLVRQAPR